MSIPAGCSKMAWRDRLLNELLPAAEIQADCQIPAFLRRDLHLFFETFEARSRRRVRTVVPEPLPEPMPLMLTEPAAEELPEPEPMPMPQPMRLLKVCCHAATSTSHPGELALMARSRVRSFSLEVFRNPLAVLALRSRTSRGVFHCNACVCLFSSGSDRVHRQVMMANRGMKRVSIPMDSGLDTLTTAIQNIYDITEPITLEVSSEEPSCRARAFRIIGRTVRNMPLPCWFTGPAPQPLPPGPRGHRPGSSSSARSFSGGHPLENRSLRTRACGKPRVVKHRHSTGSRSKSEIERADQCLK